MSDSSAALRILDEAVSQGVRLGIGQRIAEDERLDGRRIRLDGRHLLNFGSCSYLGLELHPDLRDAVVEAVERFGTQFSSSRVYVSAPPYAELEELLAKIFDARVIATPSTSLGHLAAIPTLVEQGDTLLLDHQVHHSVQTAARQVAATGVRVELVRHARMDQLEERVTQLAGEAGRIWYAADGVYSMYGDFAPFDCIEAMLNRHEQLHLYLDDAHGMSWAGKHGRGVALDHMALHPKMVMATSLNKSFAAAGGVLVFPDPERCRRVRNCGGPLLFSGPIQPPMLGAAVASARLHLSSEIDERQRRLAESIAYCDRLLAQSGLPVLSAPGSPIKFVGVGATSAAQALVARLMDDGFYANVAQFPAVSLKRGGVRFTVTLHHRKRDLEALVGALERNLDDAGLSRRSVFRAFGLPPEAAPEPSCEERAPALSVVVAQSIDQLPAAEWDRQMAGRGAFDSRALRSLEHCFGEGQEAANSWLFRYFRIVDPDGRALLSTFFTEVLWKADMLAPESVSRRVEQRREQDPDHLVMRALAMGTLLTEGDPLDVAPDSGVSRRDLLSVLIDSVEAEAHRSQIELIALRDLPADDDELDSLMRERDFLKVPAPDRMVLHLEGESESEWLQHLSRNARRHQRRSVFPWNEYYAVELLDMESRSLSEQEQRHLHSLYLEVKHRNLELNTFELPSDLLSGLISHPGWELALFRRVAAPEIPVAFMATFIAERFTVPTLLGLDYRWVPRHGLYRQCLRHAVERARSLGKERVQLGFGAGFEKRRFGARAEPCALYLQARDSFPMDVLAQVGREA